MPLPLDGQNGGATVARSDRSPPPYGSLLNQPDPVEAFEAGIPVGVSPFEVRSFKASLLHEGAARIEGNFEPFTVESGDLVLMRPGTQCTSISLAPVEIAVMLVNPVFLVDQVRWARPSHARTRKETYKDLLRRTRQPVCLRLDDPTFLAVAELFAQLTFLSKQSSAIGRVISRATELIWSIETLLLSSQVRSDRRQSVIDRTAPSTRVEIALILRMMHECYSSKLSISDLAREAALSESALRRAVQAATGFSPREYLHRIRLVKFEELVAESAMPLAEAARSVGWSSPSHARSAFARSHGMSPSEFRAEAQAARRADWLRSFDA